MLRTPFEILESDVPVVVPYADFALRQSSKKYFGFAVDLLERRVIGFTRNPRCNKTVCPRGQARSLQQDGVLKT